MRCSTTSIVSAVAVGMCLPSPAFARETCDMVLLPISYNLPTEEKVFPLPKGVYTTPEKPGKLEIVVDYPLTEKMSVGGSIEPVKFGPRPFARRAIVVAGNVTWRF